jgi:meckelin
MSGAKLASKICMTCPSGTLPVKSSQSIAGKYFEGSKYICQSCPDADHMAMSLVNNVYACTCGNAYRTAGYPGIGAQSCIPNAVASPFVSAISAAKTVNYATKGITVFNSRVFEHYFLSAASYCTFYGGAQDNHHCQTLANLCVLQLYDTNSQACSAFLNLVTSGRDSNLPGNDYNISYWSYHLPWLYYTPLYKGNEVCKFDLHSAHVTLRNFEMEYRVAMYYMNGTLKGYAPLNTLFTYCIRQAPLSGKGGGTSSSTKWQYFATSETISYSCSLRSLLESSGNSEQLVEEMLFFELFLFDRTTMRFTPVPTILTMGSSSTSSSSSSSSTMYTNDLCADSDKLVRRFYLYDAISGIETVNNDPRVMRYAAQIVLTTQLIPEFGQNAQGASTDQIYAPVLRIDYMESVPSTWSATTEVLGSSTTGSGVTTTYSYTDSTVSYSFAAYYISDMTHFFATFFGFAIAMLVVFIFFFGFRYHNWNMRHARIITQAGLTTDLGGANVKLCGEILLLLMSSFVLVFFPFMVLVSWYFFVFFKMQVVPSIMLPADDAGSSVVTAGSPYYSFVAGLYVLTLFEVLYVLIAVVYRQCQVDVFLLDWEPFHNSQLQAVQPGGTKPTLANGKSTSMAQRTREQQQVSVWRTLMVANEYAELQTQRRSDIRFTLFWIGFFLIGLDLQYNATPQPDLNDVSEGHTNMLLRFAVSTFFWLILSLGQYLWKWVVYERYFAEPPEQRFLDFCTIAKVSVFVLDEKYHGYYLHCRSPYPHAEANMMKLVDMLNQEEAGLTTDRSLDGAPSDVQSFQLFISSETRDALNQIYDVLARPMTMTELIDQRRNRSALASAHSGLSRMSNASMTQQHQQQQQQQQSNNHGNSLLNSNVWGGRRSGLGAFRQGGSGNTFKMGFAAFHSIPTERVIQAWQEMTAFLQQWVENNLSTAGLRRIIHEPSYLERMLYSAPDLTQSSTSSVFYTDRAWRFTETMFLGRELDLLLFNILVYSLVDLWFSNTLTSILLCYLADYGISYWRKNYGAYNLSRKTLVDPRFLI